MTLCSVCKTNGATQEHHLSREPELTIDICVECHNKVHLTHGVGRARGYKILKKDDYVETDEWTPIEGTFTWVDTSTKLSIIKSKITYEELHHLRCPNAAKSPMLPDGKGSCTKCRLDYVWRTLFKEDVFEMHRMWL